MTDKELLINLIERGIISEGDISDTIDMNKKLRVLAVHQQKIWQGSGKDKRWITRIKDADAPQGRRKIQKRTEKELFDYLYDYYFGEEKSYKTCTLKEIYEEWLEYKLATVRRANTVHRMDTDYNKFYKNEPLSQMIMSTPLISLTPADIKLWSYSLIKKYDLTQKAYYNMSGILRQVYRYLMEKEIINKTPFSSLSIPSETFRKSRKKKAETQIFFSDEIADIVQICIERAIRTKDTAFLVFPLLYHTGLRIGECLALNATDIDRKEHIISVNKMLAVIDERLPDGTWAKRRFEIVDYLKGNGDERDVVITDDCLDIIDRVMQINQQNYILSPVLFEGVTESNVECKLYRLCKELGITKRSPHKWRKTYISTLLNNGVDPDFVREQVGHKDLQTTYNSYTYSTTRRESQIKRLENLLSL